MRVVSSREFRDRQKMYFDLVDKNEQVIVQRGKNKAYIISPVTEIDRMSLNPELIEKIRKVEQSIKDGNFIDIKPTDDIWDSLL